MMAVSSAYFRAYMSLLQSVIGPSNSPTHRRYVNCGPVCSRLGPPLPTISSQIRASLQPLDETQHGPDRLRARALIAAVMTGTTSRGDAAWPAYLQNGAAVLTWSNSWNAPLCNSAWGLRHTAASAR